MKELDDLINEMQNKSAEGISTILRSIKGKNNRVTGLMNMKTKPSIEILKRVNKIALEKEDYETCEALKEYAKKRNIEI